MAARYPHMVLTLRPSRQLTCIFSAVHAAAFAVSCSTGLPVGLLAAVALCIGVSLNWSLRRYALLRSGAAIIAVRPLADNTFVIERLRDGTATAALLGTSYVSPRFTVLNLKIGRRWRVEHIVIVPDNSDAEAFRSLRVQLRWRHQAVH